MSQREEADSNGSDLLAAISLTLLPATRSRSVTRA
jgi:hypothetical protein